MIPVAGKSMQKTDDDDYSIDDLFTSRAAHKRSEDQDKVKERDAAIAEHKALNRTLDTCSFCFDSAEFKKHLLVAVGKTCYVCLPWHYSLTTGREIKRVANVKYICFSFTVRPRNERPQAEWVS